MVACSVVPSETFTAPFMISPGCPQSFSVEIISISNTSLCPYYIDSFDIMKPGSDSYNL
jgi:hypothetical protein